MTMKDLGAVRAMGSIFNSVVSRFPWIGSGMDRKQDINFECGYPDTITDQNYQDYYEREGIATRVVDILPSESWGLKPEILEDDDPDNQTAFEEAVADLIDKKQLWHYAQRIDKISGIGAFGILIVGANDGKPLREPMDQVVAGKPDGTQRDLLYFKPYSAASVSVAAWETDETNPRYGMPTLYTVKARSYDTESTASISENSFDVHWSRVVHVADNRTESDVNGEPRQKNVFNRIIDIRKTASSSGQMYYQGAFPGTVFTADPTVDPATLNLDAIKDDIEEWSASLARSILLQGIEPKSLTVQVSDPTPQIETYLKLISITKGIPARVFFGSEAAKLASNQDQTNWNSRLSNRQEDYLTPMLIRPLIDLLILMGVLPEPEEYSVVWPDLNTQSDMERAEVVDKLVSAMVKYAQSELSSIIPPREFLTMFIGISNDEADVILKAAMQQLKDIDGEHNHDEPKQQDPKTNEE